MPKQKPLSHNHQLKILPSLALCADSSSHLRRLHFSYAIRRSPVSRSRDTFCILHLLRREVRDSDLTDVDVVLGSPSGSRA